MVEEDVACGLRGTLSLSLPTPRAPSVPVSPPGHSNLSTCLSTALNRDRLQRTAAEPLRELKVPKGEEK